MIAAFRTVCQEIQAEVDACLTRGESADDFYELLDKAEDGVEGLEAVQAVQAMEEKERLARRASAGVVPGPASGADAAGRLQARPGSDTNPRAAEVPPLTALLARQLHRLEERAATNGPDSVAADMAELRRYIEFLVNARLTRSEDATDLLDLLESARV
jgi:hypothetical protein